MPNDVDKGRPPLEFTVLGLLAVLVVDVPDMRECGKLPRDLEELALAPEAVPMLPAALAPPP